jgi:hypothetical protein
MARGTIPALVQSVPEGNALRLRNHGKLASGAARGVPDSMGSRSGSFPTGTWAYDEDTVYVIRGKSEPFHHTDRSVLTKIAEPTPNPRARKLRSGMAVTQ